MSSNNALDEAPVREGSVLAGKYRVERVLGSGGMGVVVAAMHLELGQRVALKFVLPQALEKPEVASRFLREARAAVKIDSEHVARVLDVGRLESGAPYMVMEYLEGSDLAEHARGAALPIEDAVDFALQACAAMAVAHAAGIIHRDLKPANLFVTRRPDGSALVKVLDFGISKMSVMDAPAALTSTSALMGSPLYMSPEQAQSARHVDARTDIWSLGVILYELITGVPPFPGSTLGEVLANLMTATPKPPSQLRPGLPPGLEATILRALEKPLERRFANIGELSAALVEFAPVSSRVLHDRVSRVMSRAGLSSAPPPPRSFSSVPPPPSHVTATDLNWTQREKTPKASRLAPILIAGAATLASLGGAGFYLTRKTSPPAVAASASAASPAPISAPSEEAPVAAPTDTAVRDAPAPMPSVDDNPVASVARPVSVKPPKAVSSAAPVVAPAPVPAPTSAPPTTTTHKKNPLSIDFK